jgi:hypothetical protein
VPGIYRARHPERTVLYRLLFHYIERFLTEYEGRFEKEYGYFRPVVQEVVERYFNCANPRSGFARTRFRRKLLGDLCRAAARSLTVYFEALTGEELALTDPRLNLTYFELRFILFEVAQRGKWSQRDSLGQREQKSEIVVLLLNWDGPRRT